MPPERTISSVSSVMESARFEQVLGTRTYIKLRKLLFNVVFWTAKGARLQRAPRGHAPGPARLPAGLEHGLLRVPVLPGCARPPTHTQPPRCLVLSDGHVYDLVPLLLGPPGIIGSGLNIMCEVDGMTHDASSLGILLPSAFADFFGRRN